GGSSRSEQPVIGNAVFADSPVSATDQASNITDTYLNASGYLNNPGNALDSLDLYPKAGRLSGSRLDLSSCNLFLDHDRDYNGKPGSDIFRGAYSGEGENPGPLPRLTRKSPRGTVL